jgi:hypothetical protein
MIKVNIKLRTALTYEDLENIVFVIDGHSAFGEFRLNSSDDKYFDVTSITNKYMVASVIKREALLYFMQGKWRVVNDD